MKPHSLGSISFSTKLTPAQRAERFAALGPIAARYGAYPKGTVLPETQVLACPKVRVGDLPEGFLKQTHIEALEHNQKIASCCRHPENHEVEARKSHPDEKAPDIYVFTCTCGRQHRMFCLGTGDRRPIWDAS
jgi:hypothetical protein